jgi:flagellar hook-length control protein FliK
MYGKLLTIDNMIFAGSAVATPPASRPNISEKAMQFSPAADDIPPPPNTPEQTTTDNISPLAQNEPVNKPQQDFNKTLCKTAATETPQKHQHNTKSEKQDPASAIPSKENSTQSPSASESPIILGALVKEIATKIEPKTGHQLAKLIANLKDGKSPPMTGKTAKSAKIKLPITSDKGQSGHKTASSDKSKNQPGLHTILSKKADGTHLTDTQPGENKNTNKITIPNITTKPITDGKNTKEPMPDYPVDNDSKKAAANEKTDISGTSAIAEGQEKLKLSNNKLTSENIVNDDSKKTTSDEEAAAIPGDTKTPALVTNFQQVQTKSSKPQSQPVEIAPEKPALIDEKPSDSKVATHEVLSESSGSNGKESPRAGNELSKKSTAQELNVTDVQISTGQTKDHNSSTSNNSLNSDHKQILSQNDPQTPATEQSSPSAEGVRIANLSGQSSPGDSSPNIGKQILESIQSSLSLQRQDQQITVRLNPPELGKVFIKFQEQDAQITGLLEVSKPETRIEIQQALPQIIRSLQDSGIQIRRLEVVLSEQEQSEQEALKDQSLQNGWAQQQDSANPQVGANNSDIGGINEWLINNNSYQNISDLQEALITDDSINILI